MSDNIYQLILNATGETLYMTLISTVIAIFIGLPIGVFFTISESNGIYPLPKINKILSTLINAVRSMPEMILIIILLPLARILVGTSIGTNAAIVSISIGASPFIARIVENSLKEVEVGKIEAATSMGANTFQIIRKVLIPEAMPSIIRGITIGVIGIIGFTAIAGSIGAGGLGSLAIRFGYQRFRTDILIGTVLVLLIIVEFIQVLGDFLAKRINKKRYKFD